MELNMGKCMKNREMMLRYLASENVVPVKAPPWAKHPFELRRNEKTKKLQVGRHMVGTETTPEVLGLLGVSDYQSCKAVREHMKKIRKSMGFK